MRKQFSAASRWWGISVGMSAVSGENTSLLKIILVELALSGVIDPERAIPT